MSSCLGSLTTQVDGNTVWQLLASAQNSEDFIRPPSFSRPPTSPVLAEEGDGDDGEVYRSSRCKNLNISQILYHVSRGPNGPLSAATVLFSILYTLTSKFTFNIHLTPISAGPWTWATDGPACIAVGGDAKGSQCRFPFTYEGVVYQGCAYKPGFVILDLHMILDN